MSSAESSNKKVTSSVQNVTDSKPPFGSRFLTNEDDVWSQNAWDHVPPPEDQGETIIRSLEKQRLTPVAVEEKIKYNEKPARHWDNFYKNNANNFFRDRKWLHNEFPELLAAAQPDAGSKRIVEIGCGAGNSVFPLLSANKNPDLSLHAYDYSAHAVKVVQANPLYASPPVGSIHAAVWDLTSADGIPEDLQSGTVDVVILVFVMSALHPDEWGKAIANIHKMLKPGGLAVFRDYGRYDLTQLRFKGGRLLDENFYIRGDKTRVYFFDLDELSILFTGSKTAPRTIQAIDKTAVVEAPDEESQSLEEPGLDTADSLDFLSCPEVPEQHSSAYIPPSSIHPNLLAPFPSYLSHPLFTVEQLGVDRRLIVNRKRQLKMYRVWIQGKFRKV